MHHYVKPICGIYKITHKPTGRTYIGQSVDIGTRWSEHTNFAEAKKKWQVIKKAIYEHSVVEFTFEIIEECPKKDLDKKESYWIKHYNCVKPNGYNQNRGSSKVDINEIVYVCHVDYRDPDNYKALLEKGILSRITDEGLYEVTFLEKLKDGTVKDNYEKVFKHENDALRYVNKCQNELYDDIPPEWYGEVERQMDKND